MTQTLKYLGPDWRDEVEKRLKQDLTPEKMNFISSSMSNIYTNCPDGQDRYLFFEFMDGVFSRVLTGTGDPPRPSSGSRVTTMCLPASPGRNWVPTRP